MFNAHNMLVGFENRTAARGGERRQRRARERLRARLRMIERGEDVSGETVIVVEAEHRELRNGCKRQVCVQGGG
jgi:hypothetical protein